jgi:hypothetical protein
MHAGEPSVFFINSRTGWISRLSQVGDSRLLRTNDGGRHWTKVSDHFIQNMRFFNERVGVGDEFDGNTDRFARTTDGGHTWTTSALPGLKFASKVLFIDAEVGWIAGTNSLSDDLNGSVAMVLRTIDGGQHWASFQIPSQIGVADVRNMFFLNESLGWLLRGTTTTMALIFTSPPMVERLGVCTRIRRYKAPESGYLSFASSTPKSASPLAARTKSTLQWNGQRSAWPRSPRPVRQIRDNCSIQMMAANIGNPAHSMRGFTTARLWDRMVSNAAQAGTNRPS